MGQVEFVEDSFQKILLGPFLNTLTQISMMDLFAKTINTLTAEGFSETGTFYVFR